MSCENLSKLMFKNEIPTPQQLEERFPPRNLPEGAAVTRFAPSPTGFMHIGNVLGAFVDRLLATQSKGVFFLRLEDTDKKREVADGVSAILEGLAALNITLDEGVIAPDEAQGDYGPYTQSQRCEIYHAYAKQLLEQGLAYPCFCTADELTALRETQEQAGENPGYYGKWAKCRGLSEEEQTRRLEAGESYTLRLRSPGDASRKVIINDLIRGKLELPEYDMDVVLLKADGIPTYHFAHAIDDHLMRVTHVVRGDEWLATLPLHMQLFGLLGFRPPKYAHIAPLMKQDPETGGKRKLSKRKDPEAAVSFFTAQGYPAAAIAEYLLTLLNSNFEEWRRPNPDALLSAFPFSLKKMSASGALFDLQKLEDISKNVISRMSAGEVYAQALAWAREHNPELATRLSRDEAYATAMFAIDRGGKKPRKDIARWDQVQEVYAYFFQAPPFEDNEILQQYREIYAYADGKETWFANIKANCGDVPVRDYCGAIRVAITGRENTPDLWAIMQVLGEDEVLRRLRR